MCQKNIKKWKMKSKNERLNQVCRDFLKKRGLEPFVSFSNFSQKVRWIS